MICQSVLIASFETCAPEIEIRAGFGALASMIGVSQGTLSALAGNTLVHMLTASVAATINADLFFI